MRIFKIKNIKPFFSNLERNILQAFISGTILVPTCKTFFPISHKLTARVLTFAYYISNDYLSDTCPTSSNHSEIKCVREQQIWDERISNRPK